MKSISLNTGTTELVLVLFVLWHQTLGSQKTMTISSELKQSCDIHLNMMGHDDVNIV